MKLAFFTYPRQILAHPEKNIFKVIVTGDAFFSFSYPDLVILEEQ
jgi:hypothetical protein